MDLKIYVTPTCTWCQKLRQWLKRRRISFQEFDVVESEHARWEMIEKSGQMAVPVIMVDGKTLVGFDEAQMEEVLGKGKK